MRSLEQTSRSNSAKRAFQLNVAENSDLATALRSAEATFNADVLPRDVELMAPKDFYAAIARRLSRGRPTPENRETRRYSYLAA